MSVEAEGSFLREAARRETALDWERRGDPRFLVDALATLTIICGQARHVMEVQVVDVSANGLCFVASQPCNPGTGVKLEIEPGVAFGEVRHCEPTDTGKYRCGVDIITFR